MQAKNSANQPALVHINLPLIVDDLRSYCPFFSAANRP